MDLLKKYMNKLSSREVLERPHSDINPGLEVVCVGDCIYLNALNTNYSYGGLHRVFQKAFNKVHLQDQEIKQVLILGFGAGSVAAIIREELKMKCHITGVEADPVVISLGREYFDTARFDDLEIVASDAGEFIDTCVMQYDLIVVDIYVDFEVPARFESRAFIERLYRCLAPGGTIMFNKLVYNHDAGEQAEALERKFTGLQGKTSVIRIREGMLNKIIVFEKER